MRGNLADLAATGLASEPTLRKWIAAEPDQAWIIKRGSNGDAYEIDIEGAVIAFREKEERAAQVARDRADQIKQFALELGIGGADQEQGAPLSIAERKQLLEEELVAIKLAEKRGELVSFASAVGAFGDVLVRFRQLGQTFAARMAKKLDLTRDQIAAIELQVEADLGTLSRWMEGMEADLGDGGDLLDRTGSAAAVENPAVEDGLGCGPKPSAPAAPAGEAERERVVAPASRNRSKRASVDAGSHGRAQRGGDQ